MNILVVHNSYRQAGGEDEVYRAEVDLLRSKGHNVLTFHLKNENIEAGNLVSLASRTIWNHESYRSLRDLIRRNQPAVVHVHNTLPLVSPSAYYACAGERVPVVQTLHNYRLICPAATLFRDGNHCRECVGRTFLPAVTHKCYRGSLGASATVATMLSAHRLAGTWKRRVAVYLALSEWSRQLFSSSGLPREKVRVKPNFVYPDPGGRVERQEGSLRALFVGRLTPEKGVRQLLQAWRQIGASCPLEIVGDGPLASEVRQAAEQVPGIHWLGAIGKDEVFRRMASASMLLVPSVWHEPFSLAVIEAYAMGLPVIASGTGALQEIVLHGETGLLASPDNENLLVAAVRQLAGDVELRRKMGIRARREFTSRYTAERNYAMLMKAYRLAGGHAIQGVLDPLDACDPAVAEKA